MPGTGGDEAYTYGSFPSSVAISNNVNIIEARMTYTAATTPTTTSVSCTSTPYTICTATITPTVPDGETVSFSTSDSGSFTDMSGSPSTTCTLSGGSCQIQFLDTVAGTPTITATYPGDSAYAASFGTEAVKEGFVLDSYDNTFYWFGYSALPNSVPFGSWSVCPYVSGAKNRACSSTAFSIGTSWGVNSQDFGNDPSSPGSGSDFTPFVFLSSKAIKATGVFLNPDGTLTTTTGYITFYQLGNSNVWAADPALNRIELYDGSMDEGYILEGGTLTFSGTPSTSTFVSGVMDEYSYRYTSAMNNPAIIALDGATTCTGAAATIACAFPNAVYMPGQKSALVLTSLFYMSASAPSDSQLVSMIDSAPYLTIMPLYPIPFPWIITSPPHPAPHFSCHSSHPGNCGFGTFKWR